MSSPALSLDEVARRYVLETPPYCLTFPSSNCKTQRALTRHPCIKCELREALGIEFAQHQPPPGWWREAT